MYSIVFRFLCNVYFIWIFARQQSKLSLKKEKAKKLIGWLSFNAEF